jgi:hypothetical protein
MTDRRPGRRGVFSTKGAATTDIGTEARGMTNKDEWVVWNGSMGILDMVTIGRIEHGEAGRSAWLAAPYDVVGPFNLDRLETQGCIEFGACHVMSRRKWKEDQVELRQQARAKRRVWSMEFSDGSDDGEHRIVLNLPDDGDLTPSQINAAFRQLAKTSHPDAGGNDEIYIRLTEARDALLKTVAAAA